MKEAEFQTQVIQIARMYAWRVAHFGNSVKFVARKSGGYRTVGDSNAKGFPDLVLVRKGRLIFAELKTEKSKTTPEQDAWLNDLLETQNRYPEHDHPEVHLWRPQDLPGIATILK